jgi:poly(3-hydroxybutyrate) depolymerase
LAKASISGVRSDSRVGSLFRPAIEALVFAAFLMAAVPAHARELQPETLSLGGVERSYLVSASVATGAHPAVIVLHGARSTRRTQ